MWWARQRYGLIDTPTAAEHKTNHLLSPSYEEIMAEQQRNGGRVARCRRKMYLSFTLSGHFGHSLSWLLGGRCACMCNVSVCIFSGWPVLPILFIALLHMNSFVDKTHIIQHFSAWAHLFVNALLEVMGMFVWYSFMFNKSPAPAT